MNDTTLEPAADATADYINQAAQNGGIVELTAPSGYKFQMHQPSKLNFIFKLGTLPQTSASGAVQSWIDAGIVQPKDVTDADKARIDTMLEYAKKVTEWSYKPKLVLGEAINPGELSFSTLQDADVLFLVSWAIKGGDERAGDLLGNFPSKPQSRSLAGDGGKRSRKAGQ